MYATGFRYYFTPLPGYFSPFPHGTDTLSVTKKYLGLTGGPARFTRHSTSTALLGATCQPHMTLTSTGLSPTTVRLPRRFNFTPHASRSHGSRTTRPPQPRTCNACRLEHTHGLATSAFARHYSRNHNCFLFLRVLRCFTSPRYLPHPYTFRAGSPDMTPDIQGFPIRTSPDHSSFTNSPGLIAGYNVLHRLLVPRHPPIALSSLSHNKQQNHKTKMLASTMQFSTTTRDTHHTQQRMQPRRSHIQETTPAGVIPQNPNNVPHHKR